MPMVVPYPVTIKPGVDALDCSNTNLHEFRGITVPSGSATIMSAVVRGVYISYVLRVRYRYVYTPTGTRHTLTTWMRVNVPCIDYGALGKHDPVGIALLVEGDLDSTVGVRPDETAETFFEVMSQLASGMDASADPILLAADLADIPYFDYRPGPAMVTAYFTQPGRGNGAWVADGAPEYVDDTPGNPTGRDYWGAATQAAMDTVLEVAIALLASLKVAHGGVFPIPILVLSRSAGLIAAARWIASSVHGSRVRALIDLEGPSESIEISGATDAWPDLTADVTAVKDGTSVIPVALPTELTYSDWAAWVSTSPPPDAFVLFFRPPTPVLVDPTDNLPDTGPILPFFAIYDGGAYVDWWDPWYGTGYSEADRVSEFGAFWDERDPMDVLGSVVSGGCAYIRIQGEQAHTPPSWLEGRQALKNLLAAWGAGAAGYVFYTEGVFYCPGGTGVDHALGTPMAMTSACTWDPDSYDGTWPDWPNELAFFTNAWQVQVDIARWAVTTTFPTP